MDEQRARRLPADPPDWDHVIDKAWRPAWAIRSRHGCLAPFVAMLRDLRGKLRAAVTGRA